jgi:hypothetical protein
MADEEIPENLDLRFLAAQNVRILRELGEMRGQITNVQGHITDMQGQTQHIPQIRADIAELQAGFADMRRHMTDVQGQTQHIPQIRADIAELQIGFAAMRADQGRAGQLLEEIHETQRNHGGRLNVIDGRLAIIEKQTGLVTA